MKPLDERLRVIEERVEGLGSDLRVLRGLVETDAASALNKVRFVTEKVLHDLCSQHGVSWGAAEPTLENMIGPLVARKVIPKNVAIHVRTIQTNASPGSHFQETPLSATHVQVARMALVDLLEWHYRPRADAGEVLAPAAVARRSGWRWIAVVAAAVVVLGVAGAVHRSTRSSPGAAPPDAATPVVQVVDAGALVLPAAGLQALDDFHAPKGAAYSNLRSETLWVTAARDFSTAAKQSGAPPRWLAAAAFCEGQTALSHGDLVVARASFTRATTLEPGWPDARVALATTLSNQKDFDGALREAGEAARLEPGWWVAVATGAQVHAASGDTATAIREYRRALALAPRDPALLGMVALAYHAAHLDGEAEGFARQALEGDPDLVEPHVLLAERALEKGEAKTALAEAMRALAVSPTSVAATLAQADALAVLGQKEDARAAYRQALDRFDQQPILGAPEGRLAEVRAALAKGKLPAPRRGARPRPGGPRRTGAACSPGDFSCSYE